jgi:hypothetical protein
LAAHPDPQANGAGGGAQPMGKRPSHRGRSSVEGLRLAIDCMPVATREAMLRGVHENERIIVGAYVDELGGVCPMLAAHRCGGRTDFLSFAKSWDRFTRARGRARAASERELRILVSQLEDSLTNTSGLELDEAIREHRQLIVGGIRSRRALLDGAEPRGEILARRLRPRRRRAPGVDARRARSAASLSANA